jgi:D-aspartate ligase
MSGPSLPPAVVMGLSPTGLHAVRALAAIGVRVTGVAPGMQPGRFSRHLSRCITEADPAVRIERLCEAFPASGDPATRAVLIPTSDQDVELVMALAPRLSRHFAFQQSYNDGLAARILAKDSFHALCESHGVRVPAQHAVPASALGDLAQSLDWPCLIKPALIHEVKHQMAGRKAWIARDAAELRAIVRALPPGIGTVIVQEIVPGPESAITLYAAHVDAAGMPRQAFTARKLRQYPPGFGSASLVQSSAEPETAAISEKLLAASGYRGIASLEFKRHARSGELFAIEMNVRPSLWFALTQAAGRDVVAAAYRDLAGLPQPAPETPQRDGVRWRYALKDIASAGFYRRTPGFVLPPPDPAAAGPALARTGAVFALTDPLPALAELAGYAAKGLARLRGGKRGE